MRRKENVHPIITNVASELRSWGGVAVVGAGLSVFAGMPPASGLNALVWHALDADHEALEDLRQHIGDTAASAKALIGDEPSRIALAYDAIRKFPEARKSFQRGFCQRDAERVMKASPAHEALARLFHDGHIELVASLNWDSLFEAAYERCYGRWPAVDNELFFKPHGDVTHPEEPWTLPGDTGHIPASLINRLRALASDKPRLLVIIGYSESDEEVARKLIEPMAERWRVVRMGPNAKGELSIALPADVGVPALVDAIDPVPHHSRWFPVIFSEQHDLGPALNGEGLGARDIDALPGLPETASVVEKLLSAKSAIISGPSGCGKSGTAFRVGRIFSKRGWEVVRLSEPISDLAALASPLEGQRFTTLAIIDDAHRLDRPLLDELLHRAGPRLAMLAVITAEQPITRNEIRIDHTRAIRLIANKLEQNRAETLAAVHALDSHVSDDYSGERLEKRMEGAIKADTPWQFIFILTGGWRRVRQHLVNARAAHRADLLLLAIAARQLTNLDGPADSKDLIKAAQTLGFDQKWLTGTLQALERLRLITGTDQPKCPHLRYADVVIRTVPDDRRDPLRAPIFALLNAALSEANVSLRGISWLLEPMRFCDGLWGERDKALTEATRRIMIARCFGAPTAEERSMAGFVLSQLGAFVPNWGEVLEKHVSAISQWIAGANGVSGWGLARFLNDIDRDHHDVNNRALASVDPEAFAAKIANIATMELAGFAELLERLAYVGRDLFRVSLKAQLAPTMVRKAASAASHNTFAFGKFLHAILSFDQDLALQLVEDNAAPLAEAFAKAPLDTFEDLDHVIWFVLSFDMGLGIVSKPKPAQRKLAKRLCARLDPGACARSIESGRLRDLERWARLLFFVKRADPRLTRRIISELNFEKLDTWLQPFWAKPRHELEHFVMALAFRPEFEPARSWVAKHVNDLREIPPRFAIIAPEATAEALRAGARIAYPESFGLVWDQIVGALALLARVDKTLAEESLKTQVDALARSLTTHQANLYEKADRFLSLSEEILPGTARTIIDRMDPELALNHWPQLLKGNAAQRRTLKRLLDTALETRGPMKKVAETVRRRGTSKRK